MIRKRFHSKAKTLVFIYMKKLNQEYFQALFYYRYTVVNTQSSIEFWNSIFLHYDFFTIWFFLCKCSIKNLFFSDTILFKKLSKIKTQNLVEEYSYPCTLEMCTTNGATHYGGLWRGVTPWSFWEMVKKVCPKWTICRSRSSGANITQNYWHGPKNNK
jgi:hypothetical protein